MATLGNILSGCLRLGLFKQQHYLVWINFAGKNESRRWYFCWKSNVLAQTVCLIIKLILSTKLEAVFWEDSGEDKYSLLYLQWVSGRLCNQKASSP